MHKGIKAMEADGWEPSNELIVDDTYTYIKFRKLNKEIDRAKLNAVIDFEKFNQALADLAIDPKYYRLAKKINDSVKKGG